MYGMSLWVRAYGIPFLALTANLIMIPKGVTLRVSLNFNALVGRATAKAQGEIRAKPDMKPWVYTNKK